MIKLVKKSVNSKIYFVIEPVIYIKGK